MQKISVNKAKRIVQVMSVLVVIQFLVIVFVNFTKSYDFLDYDSSLAIRHAMEMWEHGLFLTDFNYVSSMEIDAVTFFAAPLYMLTDNLGLALGLVHIIGYIGVVYIIYDIFKNQHASKEKFLLAVLLVFTPYAIGQLDWANMLFISAAQYEFRVITMLLLVDLLIMSEEKIGRRKLVLTMAAYCIINFWTSLSTGNYVLFMIVSPFILENILDAINQKEFKVKSLRNLIILISCCVSLGGWLLQNKFIGNAPRGNLSLISASTFIENIGDSITGVFLLFGGLPLANDVSIFSSKGIAYLLRFVFVNFCFILVIKEIFRNKKYSTICRKFFAFAFVNICVLLITSTRYGAPIFEYRYHILWCVMLLLVIADFVIDYERHDNGWLRNIMVGGVLIAVVVMNIQGFNKIFQYRDTREYEKSIINVAEEFEIGTVYLYDDMTASHVIRALDPELYCISVSFQDNNWSMDMMDMYKYYGDNTLADSHNLLVCTLKEFESLPDYIKNLYLPVTKLSKEKMVLYSGKNAWDGVSGLPLPNVVTARDFPYTPGFKYIGEIDGHGSLISGNTNESGYVLWGPFSETVGGIYDITFTYSILEAGSQSAKFEVSVADGETRLAEEELLPDRNSITVRNVDIPDGERIEFRVWKPHDVVIGINEIIYERVSK